MGLAIGGIWLILYFVFTVAFGYGIKLMGDREPGFEPGNVLTVRHKHFIKPKQVNVRLCQL